MIMRIASNIDATYSYRERSCDWGTTIIAAETNDSGQIQDICDTAQVIMVRFTWCGITASFTMLDTAEGKLSR